MDFREILVHVSINAPIEKVWEFYTLPKHIINWNNASEDWHTPQAENNLIVGQRFIYRMETINGSEGFDFEGVYEEITKNKFISYTLSDNRKVDIVFAENEESTEVTIKFEAETSNSPKVQQDGWQSILTNFKRYVEAN